MPKVSDQHKQERRETIAAAALRCFERKGFTRTSMADIIDESGLSAGAIYGYYRNKYDLVRAVVTSVVSGHDDLFDEMTAGRAQPPSEVLAAFFRGLLANRWWDARVIVQIWSEAQTDPALRDVAASAFATVGAHLQGQLVRWYEAEGLSGQAARERAAAEQPMLLAAVQAFVLQRAILGIEVDDFVRPWRALDVV